MQIGIAGLGRMGAAIALRLMEVGHTLTVWNRSPEKAKPVTDAGAKLVNSPEDVAEHSDTGPQARARAWQEKLDSMTPQQKEEAFVEGH